MADRRPVILGGVLLAAAAWLLVVALEAVTGAPAPSTPAPAPPAPTGHGGAQPVRSGPAGRGAQPLEPWLVRLALDPDATVIEESAEAETGPVRHGSLTGRVVWRQEPWRPVTGLSLELARGWLDTVLPTEPGTRTTPRRDRVEAVTDERGRFVLSPVPTDCELFLLMGKGTNRHDFQKVRDVPRPGQRVDLGDLFLDLRGAVSGIVVDREGEPVPGVEVRAVDDPMLDGDAHADELRQARRAGLARFAVDGMVDGGPVPDWVVRRDAHLPFPRTSTDDEGRFLLAGLRPGLHDLFFRRDDHAGASRSVLVAAQRTTHLDDLVLRRAERIRGRVVLGRRTGEPVVGGQVAAVGVDFAMGPAPVRTDADGEFIVEGLDPRLRHVLLFRYPQGGPWLTLGQAMPPRPRQKKPRTYVVPESEVVAFHLVDSRGGTVAGGTVRLLVRGGALRPRDMELPEAYQPEETEPGRFTAELLAAFLEAAPLAVAWAPGHGTAVATLSRERWNDARRRGLSIVLLPSFPVTVKVTDPDGLPVPRVRVLVDIAAREDMDFAGSDWSALIDGQARLGRTDEAGVFVAEGMWRAAMTFAASHPDFVPSPSRTLVPRPGELVPLVLQRPGRIVGQLTEERRPVARRFRIAARPHWPERHELNGNPFLRPQQVWSNEDGSFIVPELHPGVWLLRPLDPPAPSVAGLPDDHDRYLAREVLLEPGRELHLDLEMVTRRLETPALAGRVLVDGAPGAGLVVRIARTLDEHQLRMLERMPAWRRRLSVLHRLSQSPSWMHAVTTDPWGGFAFFRLDAGGYLLRVERPWQGRMQVLGTVFGEVPEPGRKRRSTEEPPPEPLEIELETGAILASLFDAGGTPLPGRMLCLEQDGEQGADLLLLTDENGNLAGDGIPAGVYTVSLVGGGPDERLERIEIVAGETKAITLFAAARRTAGAGGR